MLLLQRAKNFLAKEPYFATYFRNVSLEKFTKEELIKIIILITKRETKKKKYGG